MGSRENTKDASAERARAWTQRVLANSGAGEEPFSEPQGWSLKWDGDGFPDETEELDRGAPPVAQEAD